MFEVYTYIHFSKSLLLVLLVLFTSCELLDHSRSHCPTKFLGKAPPRVEPEQPDGHRLPLGPSQKGGVAASKCPHSRLEASLIAGGLPPLANRQVRRIEVFGLGISWQPCQECHNFTLPSWPRAFHVSICFNIQPFACLNVAMMGLCCLD